MTLDDPCGMFFCLQGMVKDFRQCRFACCCNRVRCHSLFGNLCQWCAGSDDLSDVFSRSKPRAAMISEEARKKQQRDAGILSDSIGFYRILSDSMIFPSYLEVFGWSAAGLFESWSRLSPAVALLGRSLHPDLRGQACGRTPWRCLAPAVVVWLKWLGYDLATAQKMGWMAHWSNYWWNFFTTKWGSMSYAAMPCYSHLPLSASTLSTSLLVLELWASWGLRGNMGSVWHGPFLCYWLTSKQIVAQDRGRSYLLRWQSNLRHAKAGGMPPWELIGFQSWILPKYIENLWESGQAWCFWGNHRISSRGMSLVKNWLNDWMRDLANLASLGMADTGSG